MRKTEFLQELREALDGEVSASVIQSNISYYDQYISQEAAKGRREEEVIEEIGSPRLIAKTIIDSSEGAGETGQSKLTTMMSPSGPQVLPAALIASMAPNASLSFSQITTSMSS